MKEQRKHRRTPVILRVDYRDIDKFFSSFAENLSQGGMFISTSRPLKPGTRICLEFLLPDCALKIRTMAEVMWTRERAQSPQKKRGMGLKFQDLSENDKQKINKMLQRMRRGIL